MEPEAMPDKSKDDEKNKDDKSVEAKPVDGEYCYLQL